MPKLIVVTDKQGKILGTFLGDPVQAGKSTIQFIRPPFKDKRVEAVYHEIEVEESLLSKPAHERHKALLARMEKPKKS